MNPKHANVIDEICGVFRSRKLESVVRWNTDNTGCYVYAHRSGDPVLVAFAEIDFSKQERVDLFVASGTGESSGHTNLRSESVSFVDDIRRCIHEALSDWVPRVEEAVPL